MATRYELMTQLKELNKGFKPLAISTMKKHEIQAHIEVLKKYKKDLAAATPAPAKRGPPGPRPIPSESIVDDDWDIEVPTEPPARVYRPKKEIVQPPVQKATFVGTRVKPIEKEPEEPPSLASPPNRHRYMLTANVKEPKKCDCAKCPGH